MTVYKWYEDFKKYVYILQRAYLYVAHWNINKYLIFMIDISMAKHCTLLGIKGYLL